MNNRPLETRCPECGRIAAETICSLCKTERPELVTVKEIAAAIRLDAELRANDRVNDRLKEDRINPPHNPDGDYTVFGGRLRPGR